MNLFVRRGLAAWGRDPASEKGSRCDNSGAQTFSDFDQERSRFRLGKASLQQLQCHAGAVYSGTCQLVKSHNSVRLLRQ